jgi:hypothetical protein
MGIELDRTGAIKPGVAIRSLRWQLPQERLSHLLSTNAACEVGAVSLVSPEAARTLHDLANQPDRW